MTNPDIIPASHWVESLESEQQSPEGSTANEELETVTVSSFLRVVRRVNENNCRNKALFTLAKFTILSLGGERHKAVLDLTHFGIHLFLSRYPSSQGSSCCCNFCKGQCFIFSLMGLKNQMSG